MQTDRFMLWFCIFCEFCSNAHLLYFSAIISIWLITQVLTFLFWITKRNLLCSRCSHGGSPVWLILSCHLPAFLPSLLSGNKHPNKNYPATLNIFKALFLLVITQFLTDFNLFSRQYQQSTLSADFVPLPFLSKLQPWGKRYLWLSIAAFYILGKAVLLTSNSLFLLC